MIPNLRLYAAIGSAIIVGLILAWGLRMDHLRAVHLKERIAVQAAFDATVADVRAKTELARLSDAKHKADVEAAQDKITKEVSGDYQTKLAALRARYDSLVRMHQGAARADSSGSRGPAVPGVPSAATGVDAAPGENELPPADALIASEIALRLQALQGWVQGQAAIDRSAP